MIVEIQRTNGHWITFDLPEDKILILLSALQYDKLGDNKDINIFMESSEGLNLDLIKKIEKVFYIKLKISVCTK